MTENTAPTSVPVPARSYSSRFFALRRWLAAFLSRPGAAPRRAARLGVEACEDRTVPSITLTAFLMGSSIPAGQTATITGSVSTSNAMSTLVMSYDWNAVHFDATDTPITTDTTTFSPPNTLEAIGESHEYDTPGDYTIDVKATATYPDASTETADQTFTGHVASASGGMSGGSGGTSGGSGGTNPVAVWLGPTAQVIAEGGTGDVWVYRSGGDTTQPLTVNLGLGTDGNLDPLAAWGADYTLSGPSGGSGGSSASLSASGGTVTFGANQTAVDLGVAALTDALAEGTEGFRVTVQTGTGYTPGGASGGMSGGSTTADVQITDGGMSGGSGGSGGTSPAPTTTALSASPNPATYGQAVTLSATVSASASGGATPTGGVTFWDGMSYLGSGTLTSGTATLVTSALNSGIHFLRASYGGDANDTASSGSASETVTPAALTVTAGSATKVYGQANPSFTATITGFVNGDGPGVVGGAPALTTSATTASGVGSYPITPALGTLSASNYTFAFVGGTLSVTPASLSVTADAQAKVYGAADPALTYTSTGLVNGDGLSGSLTRAAGENVGAYPITQGTLTAGPNYTLSFTGANLTITPAALTLTATDQTRAYGFGGASAALGTTGFTTTVGTLYGTDSLAGVTFSTAAPVSGSGNYAAGTWDLTPSAATGSGLSNYTITYQAGTLTVSQLPVSITGFTVANKVYNASIIATITTAGTLSGLLSGDGVGLDSSSAVASFSDPNVGTGKPVTGAGFALSGPDAGNYTLTQPTTTADITAPPDDTVSGTVWVDANEDQTYDPGDPGLAGVVVTLSDTSGNPVTDTYGNTVQPVTTDASGTYKFSKLPAGSYTVSFTAPAGYQLEPSWQATWAGAASTPGLSSVLNVGASDLAGDVIDDYPGEITSDVSTTQPPAAWTIDDLRTILNKNPDAKAILDAADKDKITLKSGATLTGGGWNPTKKEIIVDPKVKDTNVAANILLFELLRYKGSSSQVDLDKQAKDGKLTSEQYATKCEQLTYSYIQEHHIMAARGVQAGFWDKSLDAFATNLSGNWKDFDGYLKSAKSSGHYNVFTARYNDFNKK